MTTETTQRRGWASFHGGHSHHVDGSGTVRDIAAAAAERGFIAFGFTEHFTMPPHREFSPDGKRAEKYGRCDWIVEYIAEVQAAQREHADKLTILLGAELEFLRGAEQWTKARVGCWPFQYFVGSVHHVNFDGVDYAIDWDRPRVDGAIAAAGSPERLYLHYYDHVLDLLDWRLASVVGHIDLVKIHLRPDEQVDTPAIRAKVSGVLETMRDRGVAIDVNCRGLIKPCKAIYPADWILEEACRIGVAVTLGDDSHGPEQVGARLEHGVAALRRAGYHQMWLVRPGASLEPTELPG
jgi:histidinol-phosphatase (PHP family)